MQSCTIRFFKLEQDKIPTWPQERDLATYAKYTTIDFPNELTDGMTWIDIGCRSGLALSESRTFCKATLIGVNAHKIAVLPGIISVYSELPGKLEIYDRFQSNVDLLTDIYGAFTYDNEPLKALIYEASLLKPRGKAVIISLQAKLGNKVNLQAIQNFFATILGQTITFKRFRSYTNHLKRPLNSLRITITGQSRSKLRLNELYKLAQEQVGTPQKERILYSPSDQSCEIWKIVYR